MLLYHIHHSKLAHFSFLLRERYIFGVCDENLPIRINYLIDESETIGENGPRTHGRNADFSMLHHHLEGNSYGESTIQLVKTKIIHYLLWRCEKGLHREINLLFMIAGHTKYVLEC